MVNKPIISQKIGIKKLGDTDSIVASSIALKHNRYQNHTKKRRLSDLKNSFTGVGLDSVVFTILGVPMGGSFPPTTRPTKTQPAKEGLPNLPTGNGHLHSLARHGKENTSVIQEGIASCWMYSD
jgi:hypothetical protein